MNMRENLVIKKKRKDGKNKINKNNMKNKEKNK